MPSGETLAVPEDEITVLKDQAKYFCLQSLVDMLEPSAAPEPAVPAPEPAVPAVAPMDTTIVTDPRHLQTLQEWWPSSTFTLVYR